MAETRVGRVIASKPSRSIKPGREPAELRSFEVLLRMQPGITPRQELALERDLALYLMERELVGEGGALEMSIRSDSRDLTVTDQVDLIARLMSSAPVAVAEIAAQAREDGSVDLEARDARPNELIRACYSDLALAPVIELYRLGRIRADLVAEVLRA
jgi:hypothetical protein